MENKAQNSCLESPTIKHSATLQNQSSLPDYNEVIQAASKSEVKQTKVAHKTSPKPTLLHQDSAKFLTVNQHPRKLSTSLTSKCEIPSFQLKLFFPCNENCDKNNEILNKFL